jgi:hypothetical protein
MIELAFVACLILDGETCQRQSFLYSDVGVMLCMMRGQARLAEWSGAHPGWTIEKWSCRFHDPSRADI